MVFRPINFVACAVLNPFSSVSGLTWNVLSKIFVICVPLDGWKKRHVCTCVQLIIGLVLQFVSEFFSGAFFQPAGSDSLVSVRYPIKATCGETLVQDGWTD